MMRFCSITLSLENILVISKVADELLLSDLLPIMDHNTQLSLHVESHKLLPSIKSLKFTCAIWPTQCLLLKEFVPVDHG